MKTFFAVLACICFFLDAIQVQSSIKWFSLGIMFVVAAVLLPL